jgi:hypothetical protein
MEVTTVAPIIQAVTTFVLGIVAGFIAWRQWRTSRDRIVLDLFERRFQVFQELTRAISDAFHKPHVGVPDLANFDGATERARFLFGPEVHSYLIEVRRHLVDLIAMGRSLADMPDGAQRTRAENKISDALNEMHVFYGNLADLVTPYLRIGTR